MTAGTNRFGWLGGLALVVILSAGVYAQGTTLRLVSTAWPPFTGESADSRVALDLVEAALKRIGMGAVTEIVTPADYTEALLNPRFDGSAAAWRDPAREEELVFSEPYLENRLVLVGRKGADVSAPGLEALAGRRIAIVGGYAYGDIEATGPAFVRTESDQASLRQLLDGGVEYALIDELVVHYIADAHAADAEARLQIGTTALVDRPLHLAVRRSRPDADAIVTRFNAQVRTMIADGTYHRLLNVEWLLADVDGDGRLEYVPNGPIVGTAPPDEAYSLVSASDRAAAEAASQPRFYLGGRIYEDWASVPNTYKRNTSSVPDYRRSTATIFTFTW